MLRHVTLRLGDHRRHAHVRKCLGDWIGLRLRLRLLLGRRLRLRGPRLLRREIVPVLVVAHLTALEVDRARGARVELLVLVRRLGPPAAEQSAQACAHRGLKLGLWLPRDSECRALAAGAVKLRGDRKRT
eukprot:scaffold99800_cov63-Phaeocystis_antarctica.AAC.1